MYGYELARRLKVRHADVRLLALTGYGEPAQAQAPQDNHFEARLIKQCVGALFARLFEPSPTNVRIRVVEVGSSRV